MIIIKIVARSNSIKFGIDKTSDTLLPRLCGVNSETMRHITSGCSKLAQREHRNRHDKEALWVHWEISKKYGLEASSKCQEYQPFPVTKNEEVKLTSNMTISADKKL